MPLVKVRRFAQVTIPAELREQFNLAEGDYLEAEAIKEGILLKPVAVVDRAKARQQLKELLDRVHARMPRRKKSAKAEEEEIARMVKDFRKQHA
ncbi:MAG: AbrB/MazE/SpoVT family DNA-binding domain-containing protein [Candidatus Entotheonellia bacterium]